MTLREAATSALAGPLVNARATSAGDAPCAPTPGSRRIERGRSRRASPTARGCVAPITAPTAESPCSPTRSAPHSATSSATWCHTARPSDSTRSCTSAPPAFDVLITQKSPAPSRRHAARNGSTESARRSAKCVVATAATSVTVLSPRDSEGRVARGPQYLRSRCRLAALDCLLELAACRELRHRCCRDRHLLRRVARIHALPLRAPLRRELPKPRECDLSAAPQCVGDRVEEGVNSPRRVSTR